MPWKRYKQENALTITDIYSLFENHFDNKFIFEGESHDFWECVYVISGSMTVSGDGRIYTLTSGEMIFHKPMEFHKLSLSSSSEADALIFTYSAKGELVPFFRDKVFRLSGSQKETVTSLLRYMRRAHRGVNLNRLPKEFRYIEPHSKDKAYTETVVSYLHILLLSLASGGRTAVIEQNTNARIFHSAVEFMKANLDCRTNTDEIAGYANTSVSTLKRIFQNYVGLPVHKYYLTLKIQYATELLQSGFSVTNAAEKTGFSSQAHFSKIYKNMTGKNPSEVKSQGLAE